MERPVERPYPLTRSEDEHGFVSMMQFAFELGLSSGRELDSSSITATKGLILPTLCPIFTVE